MEGAVVYPCCVEGCLQTHISSVTACIATTSHMASHYAALGLCDIAQGEGATGVRVLGTQTYNLHRRHSPFPQTHAPLRPAKLLGAGGYPEATSPGHSPPPSPPLLPLPGVPYRGLTRLPAARVWGFPRSVLLLPTLGLPWVRTPQVAETGLGGGESSGIPAKDLLQAQKVQQSPLPP